MKSSIKKFSIVVDDWKFDVFKKRLHEAGFQFSRQRGHRNKTQLLSIKTNEPSALTETVRSANNECDRLRRKRKSFMTVGAGTE